MRLCKQIRHGEAIIMQFDGMIRVDGKYFSPMVTANFGGIRAIVAIEHHESLSTAERSLQQMMAKFQVVDVVDI